MTFRSKIMGSDGTDRQTDVQTVPTALTWRG